MPYNLPNLLTWLRILAIPLFVGIFYLPHDWLSPVNQNLVATLIFTGAAVTDWLDGYLARVLNQASAFGAFLDPVADKLMVSAALIVLVYLERLDAPIALIIIGREITVSALREWMAQLGQSRSVAVSFLGKIKTTSQMIAIPLLLYHESIGDAFDSQQIGTWLIYIAAVLTLWSMFYYLKAALPQALRSDSDDIR
ncbi:MAG: CDP-diacylglycerol--glycerol-3-phosphate 3-phosphatidyltransferase [Nitrosomonas sp.]